MVCTTNRRILSHYVHLFWNTVDICLFKQCTMVWINKVTLINVVKFNTIMSNNNKNHSLTLKMLFYCFVLHNLNKLLINCMNDYFGIYVVSLFPIILQTVCSYINIIHVTKKKGSRDQRLLINQSTPYTLDLSSALHIRTAEISVYW